MIGLNIAAKNEACGKNVKLKFGDLADLTSESFISVLETSETALV